MQQRRAERAAVWLSQQVKVADGTREQNTVAVPNGRTWRSTGDLSTYDRTHDPAVVYPGPNGGTCTKAEISHPDRDSCWERTVAELLEQNPAVLRWMRNHRLRWSIP